MDVPHVRQLCPEHGFEKKGSECNAAKCAKVRPSTTCVFTNRTAYTALANSTYHICLHLAASYVCCDIASSFINGKKITYRLGAAHALGGCALHCQTRFADMRLGVRAVPLLHLRRRSLALPALGLGCGPTCCSPGC